MQLDSFGQSHNVRRGGARILDIAEGVLVALRGCTVNQAFVEIVQTAKTHGVGTLSLADALVALAEDRTATGDDAALLAARGAWEDLFGTIRHGCGVRFDPEDDAASGA